MQHKGYNESVLLSNLGQNIRYQGQERQYELGLNWDSFKYRNYDPAIGRFFNVDPLAEKYVYNSPYAFQENKLGMGVELEGLEMVSNRSEDGKSVTVDYYVRPQNDSRLTNLEFQKLVEARANLVETSWVGKTANGTTITSVNVYCDPKATVSWEYNELISVDGTEEGNARGYTMRKGDKNNNRTQVNAYSELGVDGKLAPLTPKAIRNMTKTGAHEDLHVAGIPDIGDGTNPQLEFEMLNDPKGNVMAEPPIDQKTQKPVKGTVDGTNVTPHQKDFIIRSTTPRN